MQKNEDCQVALFDALPLFAFEHSRPRLVDPDGDAVCFTIEDLYLMTVPWLVGREPQALRLGTLVADGTRLYIVGLAKMG